MTKISPIHSDDLHSFALVGAQSGLTREIRNIASQARWRVIVCQSSSQLSARLNSNPTPDISAVFLEAPASTKDTRDLLASVKNCRPLTPVLVITPTASTSALVEMLRAGATGFVAKPLTAERVLQTLRAVTTNGMQEYFELLPIREEFHGVAEFSSIVGCDSSFRAVLAQAAMAARGHGHVLVAGENGTGKKMLAKAIHTASSRAAGPVQVVNLAEPLDSDVDSILFGHRRAAFSGTPEQRAGAFQSCDGGTLVLDAIDQLPAPQQQRLARAIKDGRAYPLGAIYGFLVDVRIIALSQRPLYDLVKSGTFSAELYRLLAPTQLALPPLRKRWGDIALLARHFLAKLGKEASLCNLELAQDAISLLQSFPWPGNVPQLQSVLLRAAALSEASRLTADNFPQLLRAVRKHCGSNWMPESAIPNLEGVNLYTSHGDLRTLSEIEADVIRLAVKHYRGRMSEAARRLCIGRSTLYRKMAELDLEGSME